MRSFTHKFILLLCALCFSVALQAQSDIDQYLNKLGLNQALYPPQDILKTKSLVLLSVPMDEAPSEWQEILDEMQTFFSGVGVDAVAYLEVDKFDVALNEPQQFPDFINKRGIENLIILSSENVEGPFFIAMTQFNNQESMYAKGASAFARLATDLTPVWDELGTYFKTGQFQRTNLLVNETPEFFYPSVQPGIVARSIPPQVTEFKIAMKPIDVSKYDDLPVFKIQYNNLFASDSLFQAIDRQNQRFQSLSTDSTNTMGVVSLTDDDATLRRAGFIYELKMLKAKESTLNEWIPLPDKQKPSEKVVYKFYLDDLRTNTIFIGSEWDASENWFDALNAFVAQIRKAAASNGN